MLLTISTTHRPATDLGYLLHKNPARAQSFELAFGQAHVFYPDATDERYLRHRRSLMSQAMAQLMEEDTPDPDEVQETAAEEEWAIEERISLNEQRIGAVVAALRASGAKRVLDLGCGEGKLISALLKDRDFSEIVGVDVSYRSLEKAQDKLRLDQLAPAQRERIKLLHGSLIYRDKRLNGYDAAAVVEVIEHMDFARLAAFERVLFEFARPKSVVLTTPNAEYNVKWESLPAGKMRHRDHRFEWTRDQFQSWATGIRERFGYDVRFLPVGPEDAIVGAPTQMAVFEENETYTTHTSHTSYKTYKRNS